MARLFDLGNKAPFWKVLEIFGAVLSGSAKTYCRPADGPPPYATRPIQIGLLIGAQEVALRVARVPATEAGAGGALLGGSGPSAVRQLNVGGNERSYRLGQGTPVSCSETSKRIKANTVNSYTLGKAGRGMHHRSP